MEMIKVSPRGCSSVLGWICYAEKTHGSYILPYISSTKSPQQIMGSLVKDYFAAKQGQTPDRIYHVTVMPCYDKKLEASRQDFYSDLYGTRDVDCVITTGIIFCLAHLSKSHENTEDENLLYLMLVMWPTGLLLTIKIQLQDSVPEN